MSKPFKPLVEFRRFGEVRVHAGLPLMGEKTIQPEEMAERRVKKKIHPPKYLTGSQTKKWKSQCG